MSKSTKTGGSKAPSRKKRQAQAALETPAAAAPAATTDAAVEPEAVTAAPPATEAASPDPSPAETQAPEETAASGADAPEGAVQDQSAAPEGAADPEPVKTEEPEKAEEPQAFPATYKITNRTRIRLVLPRARVTVEPYSAGTFEVRDEGHLKEVTLEASTLEFLNNVPRGSIHVERQESSTDPAGAV